MDQVTRTLVRTRFLRERAGARVVFMTFLDNGNALVCFDDGVHRIITQQDGIDMWDKLWHDTANGIETSGWERA